MRLLLTGSAGRMGQALMAALAPQHAVQGLDLRAAPGTVWTGDLGDAALLRQALRGQDAVLHAAALHAPQVGVQPDATFWRVNVQATRALADAAEAAGVPHLVYLSTTALYGAGGGLGAGGAADWVDEDTPPAPRTIYHHTKLAAEALLAERARAGAFALTVLRMGRCFPEPAAVMAVARLHRGIDARDVAAAHARLLSQPLVPGVRRFVLSGATPFQRGDAAALGHDAPAVLRQRAPDLVAAFARRGWSLPARIDRVYDSARAQAALGWRPAHGWSAVLDQADARDPAVQGAPGQPLADWRPTTDRHAPGRPLRDPEPCL